MRRLGYRSKSLIRPEHAKALKEVLTPTAEELTRAQAIVDGFNAARSRGEDRALVNGLWVEVPTYRNAVRLIERAHRLGLSAWMKMPLRRHRAQERTSGAGLRRAN